MVEAKLTLKGVGVGSEKRYTLNPLCSSIPATSSANLEKKLITVFDAGKYPLKTIGKSLSKLMCSLCHAYHK